MNGGFESGTFTGWTLARGYNAGVTSASSTNWYISNVVPVTGAGGPGHAVLGVGGNDPLVGPAIPVVPPGGGAFSARLGSGTVDRYAYVLRQTFLVDAATVQFYFRYALVFDYISTHLFKDQPFFMVRVLDSSGAVVQQFLKVADSSDPFFESMFGGQILYRRWSCARLDLAAWLGQPVTVEFTAAGCVYSVHAGYAYLDGICTEPSSVSFTLPERICEHQVVVADGSASVGDTAHFWSVQESDAGWNPVGPEVSSWFPGHAGVFDLSEFYGQYGGTFQCGRYYSVKLAVKTECQQWQQQMKLLFIECAPVADAGPDVVVCACGNVRLGVHPEPGYLYSWWPIDGLSDPNVSHPLLDLGAFSDPAVPFPSVYVVTVTGPNGCSSSDSVVVTVLCRPSVTITSEPDSICGTAVRLTAHTCGDDVRYLWTPGGATTSSITVDPRVPTDYTVAVSNQCGTTISPPFTAVSHVPLKGPFPPVQCPNVFTPNGDGVNDIYQVTDQSHPVGYVPAYNATGYRFEVFNRWGSLVATLSGQTATGFGNRSIPGWDGIATQSVHYNWWQRHILKRVNADAGVQLSNGTYFYLFYLENCDRGLTDVCHGFAQIFH
jgi:gliding motility-associated-like protein